MASKHETVAAALIAQLASVIQAGVNGYVYTPTVRRVVFFDEAYLDPTLSTIYLVRPGKETRLLQSNRDTKATLEVFVLAATAYQSTTEQPASEGSPTRWQAAADLAADIVQCISAGNTIGGTAIDAASNFAVDYERYLPKWAVAEVSFTVTYRYDTGSR